MARAAARMPATTADPAPKPPPPAESCRGCWRADQREVFRLRCGHVYCGPCVADLARVAMGAPTQLLPLRCCQLPVPAAALVSALLAPELAFYQHLTTQGVDAKRQLVRDTTMAPLATACDFCGLVVWLIGPQDADKLLPCGHVYCDDCHAGLRAAATADARVCCTEMPDGAATHSGAGHGHELTPPAPPKKSKRAPPRATRPHGGPELVPQGQATTSRGKRKASQQVAIELDEEDTAQTGACVACSVPLTGIKTALVPVVAVATALGKKLLPKYEAVVAKRAEAIAAIPVDKRKSKTGTQANTKKQRVEPTPSQANDSAAPTEPCVSCGADATAATDDYLRGPCGHVYCLTCLTTMARLSLEDRTLVPIRCCGKEFPLDYVCRTLSSTQMAQYERFLAEKDWRASDLSSDREYARVVKKLRGKQCPACGVGVQKIDGCSTMHCPHGHTFCWKCAATPCTCYYRA